MPAVSSRIFRANRDKEAWVKACLNLKGFAIGAHEQTPQHCVWLSTLMLHQVDAMTTRVDTVFSQHQHKFYTSATHSYHTPGNGLTDPAIQYGAYADFAALNGLISEDARQLILSAFPACKTAIDVCNGHEYVHNYSSSLACLAHSHVWCFRSWKAECLLALQYCQTTQVSSILTLAGNINIYDIRKECIGDLCYDFSLMEEYLNLPETRKALGVGDRECGCTVLLVLNTMHRHRWESCNMQVYQVRSAAMQ